LPVDLDNLKLLAVCCNLVVLFQDEEEEIKLEINVLKKVCYATVFYSLSNMFL